MSQESPAERVLAGRESPDLQESPAERVLAARQSPDLRERALAGRRRIYVELAIVLLITFGMSGIRATLRLIEALLQPTPLSEQTTTLHANASQLPWLDLALQMCSAGTLFAWGALALYLLVGHTNMPTTHNRGRHKTPTPKHNRWRRKPSTTHNRGRHQTPTPKHNRWRRKTPTPSMRPRWSDLGWGAALAAIIGIPGLGFYVAAVHLGYSKQVIPTTLEHLWWEVPILLSYSLANAFAEEVVVVLWFITRLRQLQCAPWLAIAIAAVLRGSYHLYQGISAGFGNILMGLLFGWVYVRCGRVWPLVVAHFLIDAVAFVGYSALGGNLSWLGL